MYGVWYHTSGAANAGREGPDVGRRCDWSCEWHGLGSKQDEGLSRGIVCYMLLHYIRYGGIVCTRV